MDTKNTMVKNIIIKESDMSYENAIKKAEEKLIKSVELRMRSDVPIAFCLSVELIQIALYQ